MLPVRFPPLSMMRWIPCVAERAAARLAETGPESTLSTATGDGFETGFAKNPITPKRMGNETSGTNSAVIIVRLSRIRSSSSFRATRTMALARDAGIAFHQIDEDLLKTAG